MKIFLLFFVASTLAAPIDYKANITLTHTGDKLDVASLDQIDHVDGIQPEMAKALKDAIQQEWPDCYQHMGDTSYQASTPAPNDPFWSMPGLTNFHIDFVDSSTTGPISTSLPGADEVITANGPAVIATDTSFTLVYPQTSTSTMMSPIDSTAVHAETSTASIETSSSTDGTSTSNNLITPSTSTAGLSSDSSTAVVPDATGSTPSMEGTAMTLIESETPTVSPLEPSTTISPDNNHNTDVNMISTTVSNH